MSYLGRQKGGGAPPNERACFMHLFFILYTKWQLYFAPVGSLEMRPSNSSQILHFMNLDKWLIEYIATVATWDVSGCCWRHTCALEGCPRLQWPTNSGLPTTLWLSHRQPTTWKRPPAKSTNLMHDKTHTHYSITVTCCKLPLYYSSVSCGHLWSRLPC